MTRTFARAVPVAAAIAVVIWGPGVWATAASGVVILAWLLAISVAEGPRGRRSAGDAAETLFITVAAAATVAAVFQPAPIAAWVAVPLGVAAAATAYAVAVHRRQPNGPVGSRNGHEP